MALFAERGYTKTTVGDIAARAGLTERTFFNHFTDKREVLFAGSEHFVKQIVDAVRAAPSRNHSSTPCWWPTSRQATSSTSAARPRVNVASSSPRSQSS